ncbi:MAG: hypothetical protein WC998_00465 [Candidatus Paceibacterota bacterium]
MKESDIVKKLENALTAQGCFAVKYTPSQFSRTGIPDLLVCINSRFVGIEVKVVENENRTPDVTDLQYNKLEKIANARGLGLVVAYEKNGKKKWRVYKTISYGSPPWSVNGYYLNPTELVSKLIEKLKV